MWSVLNESVVRSTVRVKLDSDDVDKGNYRHHMLKEIHEQPKVIRDTLEGRLTKTRVLEPAFGVKAAAIFDRVKSVTIVACGSSYYTGSIAQVLDRRHRRDAVPSRDRERVPLPRRRGAARHVCS